MTVEITDVTGRKVVTQNFASLQQGTYQLRVTLSTAGVYFLTASMNGQVSSVKMVNGGNGGADEIVLNDHVGTQSTASGTQPKNAPKGTIPNPFVPGDQMKYVGYATVNGLESESLPVTQAQTGSENLSLLFTPCPGAATVTDIDGNVYNTVQIGNQCWMRENLRTKRYANGLSIAPGSITSTTTAYRYYPNNDQSNVSTHGYLYNWKAVMGNSSSSNANPSGVQGICPNGWHVPSVAEWNQLRDYVSSQPQYVCGDLSYHIAKALASTTGWYEYEYGECTVGNDPSTNNATGFSALPAGDYGGNYGDFGYGAYFWSTTEFNVNYTNAINRYLYYYGAVLSGVAAYRYSGFSVC